MCCIIYVLFATKCHLFDKFVFFCCNDTFFINHALNLNTHAGRIKVKELATIILKQYCIHGASYMFGGLSFSCSSTVLRQVAVWVCAWLMCAYCLVKRTCAHC